MWPLAARAPDQTCSSARQNLVVSPYKVEFVSLKEARNREDLKMRILIASVAIALMMVSAHAQDMGKTRKHQHTQKTENSTKMKAADEQAYKEALKRIPDSTKKVDPWQNVR